MLVFVVGTFQSSRPRVRRPRRVDVLVRLLLFVALLVVARMLFLS